MPVTSAIQAASPLVNGLFSLVDDLFTTQEEKDQAKLKIMELQQSGALAQMAVNSNEAKHRSIFVAGWRPAVGWICALAFGWSFFIGPIFKTVYATVSVIAGTPVDLSGFPEPDMSEMTPVLMGMLGLGAMRTWEKQKGVAR